MLEIDSTQQAKLASIIAQPVIKDHHFHELQWADIEREDLVFENCIFTQNNFASATLKNLAAYRCQFNTCKFNHADLSEALFDACHFYEVKTNKGPDFSYTK